MNWLEEERRRQEELNRQNLVNSYRQGRTGDYLKNTASVINSGNNLLKSGTNAANFGQKVQDFGSKLGNYNSPVMKNIGNGISKIGQETTNLGNEFQNKIDNGLSGITNKFSSFGGQGNQTVNQAIDNAVNNVTSNGAIGDAINNSVNGLADNSGALSGALQDATSVGDIAGAEAAGGANPVGLVTGGLNAAGDFANGDYVKGGLGTVSTIAPLFGPIGMGIGAIAGLGSKILDIFTGGEDKAAAMAQSQKGLEEIQNFSNQKKNENAKQLEQQGNAIQQQLAQNTGMQDLYGAYQAGQPTYDDYIKEIYGL